MQAHADRPRHQVKQQSKHPVRHLALPYLVPVLPLPPACSLVRLPAVATGWDLTNLLNQVAYIFQAHPAAGLLYWDLCECAARRSSARIHGSFFSFMHPYTRRDQNNNGMEWFSLAPSPGKCAGLNIVCEVVVKCSDHCSTKT